MGVPIVWSGIFLKVIIELPNSVITITTINSGLVTKYTKLQQLQ
jgi:hypothetical protein